MSLDDIKNKILDFEPIFHHPEFGTKRADFARVMGDDYWETGASGKRYDREYILDVLEERYSKPFKDEWKISDAKVQPLKPNLYLFTYILDKGGRTSSRSTIWEETENGFIAHYHQGTIVE